MNVEPPSVPLPPPPAAGTLEPPGRVWRTAALVVMEKPARLPTRCLHCGQPTERTLRRTLSWHPRQLLMSLVPIPLLSLAAAVVARRATLELPLCRRHLWWRRWKSGLGMFVFIVGIVGMLGAALIQNGYVAAGGAVLLVAGLVLMAWNAEPVVAVKIDDRFVWLKRVSAQYLERLPRAPDWLPPL